MMNKMDWARLIEEHRRGVQSDNNSNHKATKDVVDSGGNSRSYNEILNQHHQFTQQQQLAELNSRYNAVLAAAASSAHLLERLHLNSGLRLTGNVHDSSQRFLQTEPLLPAQMSLAASHVGSAPTPSGRCNVAELAAFQQQLLLDEHDRQELMAQTTLKNYLQRKQQQQKDIIDSQRMSPNQPLISNFLHKVGILQQGNAVSDEPETRPRKMPRRKEPSKSEHFFQAFKPKEKLPIHINEQEDVCTSTANKDAINEDDENKSPLKQDREQQQNSIVKETFTLKPVSTKNLGFPLPPEPTNFARFINSKKDTHQKEQLRILDTRHPSYFNLNRVRNDWDRLNTCNLNDHELRETFIKEFFSRKILSRNIYDNPSLQRRAEMILSADKCKTYGELQK